MPSHLWLFCVGLLGFFVYLATAVNDVSTCTVPMLELANVSCV